LLAHVHAEFQAEFPDASAQATECFLNLGRVATTMLSALNRFLDGFGVPSYTGLNALTVLAGADGPMPASVVSQRMVVARPTATGIFNTLEAHGLVARTAHGTDGRMRLVTLTDAGRELVEHVLPEVHRFERDLLDALEPSQQEALLDILSALAARLETLSRETGD